MTIHVLSLNHRRTPLDMRERVAVDIDSAGAAARDLASAPGVREAVVLSTCNRTEIWVDMEEEAGISCRTTLMAFLAARAGGPAEELAGFADFFDEPAAVRHIFSVTAALEALALGETEILGQVKEAFHAARDAGAVGGASLNRSGPAKPAAVGRSSAGASNDLASDASIRKAPAAFGPAKPALARCVERAFSAAKRVREETRFGRRKISVSSIAVDVAARVFDDLPKRTVLVLGTGHMARSALEYFADRQPAADSAMDGPGGVRKAGGGPAKVLVASRTAERAAEFGRPFDAEPHTYDEVPALLVRADIVLAGAAPPAPLSAAALAAAVARRSGEPLVVIDIAVPRAVDPAASRVAGVILYNIDDLGVLAAEGRETRARDADAARSLLEDEARRFEEDLRVWRAGDPLKDVRAAMAAMAEAEVERLGPVLARMAPADAEKVRRALERLSGKFLHRPHAAVAEALRRGDGQDLLDALNRLFGEEDDGPDEETE
jgi:glutamyl-tRNA reductase